VLALFFRSQWPSAELGEENEAFSRGKSLILLVLVKFGREARASELDDTDRLAFVVAVRVRAMAQR